MTATTLTNIFHQCFAYAQPQYYAQNTATYTLSNGVGFSSAFFISHRTINVHPGKEGKWPFGCINPRIERVLVKVKCVLRCGGGWISDGWIEQRVVHQNI